MYHWKRRAAENLTFADHRHERRRGRMDVDYQDQFRQRERGDADVKQGMDRVSSPSELSQFNKFRARSYDRPWAQDVPAAKKPSPSTSGKNASSERSNSWNKGSVSRLPAISSRTQNKNVELVISSMTPRRANATLASNRNKDQSPPRHNKDGSVVVKNRALKVSPRGKTKDLKQSRDTPKGEKKANTPQGHVGRADGSARPNPVLTLTLESELLANYWRPLASSAPRCPVGALGPGPSWWCDLFGSFSEDGSIGEDLQDAYREHFSTDTTVLSVSESIPSEDSSIVEDPRDTYREHFSTDTTVLSVPESIPSEDSSIVEDPRDTYGEHFSNVPSEAPSGTGTPSSLLAPLSDSLRSLDVLSSASEEEEEDEECGSALWRDTDRESYYIPVRWTGSQSSSAATSSAHSARRLHRLQPLSSPSSTSGILSGSGGYSPLPALAQIGQARVAPLSRIPVLVTRGSVASQAARTGRLLPELAVDHRRRPPPGWMTAQRREEPAVPRTRFSGRHSGTPVSEQEEPERSQASLEESSDEDEVEVDRCRICLSGACLSTNPLLAPCQCSGSVRFVHHDCLKRWLQTKIDSGSDLNDVETCELCRGNLWVMDLDLDLDFIDYYQRLQAPQLHSGDDDSSSALLHVFKSRVTL